MINQMYNHIQLSGKTEKEKFYESEIINNLTLSKDPTDIYLLIYQFYT